MSRLAVCLLLLPGLAGCALFGGEAPAGAGNREGWRSASGKPPTRAEYAAVLAACRNNAVRDAQNKPLAACLADLGLKRAE